MRPSAAGAGDRRRLEAEAPKETPMKLTLIILAGVLVVAAAAGY